MRRSAPGACNGPIGGQPRDGTLRSWAVLARRVPERLDQDLGAGALGPYGDLFTSYGVTVAALGQLGPVASHHHLERPPTSHVYVCPRLQ
jgi:hypothetical protein